MKNKLAVMASLCALVCLITASDQAAEACREGLRLCAELLLPSLFPFFVLSLLLSRLGFPAWLGQKIAPAAARLFRVSGAGATALVVGLCGGYPLGAVYITDLLKRGTIRPREAERLLAFCNNSGPAFIVGAVGVGVFRSAALGLRLYAVHAAAAVCTGLLLRFWRSPLVFHPAGRDIAETPDMRLFFPQRGKMSRPAVTDEGVGQSDAVPLSPPLPFSRALADAVHQAVEALLGVCGFVVCFTVFTGLLDANGFFSAAAQALSRLSGASYAWCRALLCGLLELGSGAGAMRGLPVTRQSLSLAAFLLGWGGLSVHFQTLAVLADADVKSAPHTAGRLMSAAISAALAYFVF